MFFGEKHQFLDVQGAQIGKQQKQSQRHGGIPYPGDHKGLAGTIAVIGVLEPEPDQQIRAQPHAFPAHEEQ